LGYAGLANSVLVDSWKEVALPLSSICFLISAIMTKQLSDLIS